MRAEPAGAADLLAVSAATAYHEAIEAMRWARQLVASGEAEPADIAIASVTPADYDDHFLALRADANLDLHFVHGVKITACREGQAAAALADILVRGLSQTRMRRLAALLGVLSRARSGRCPRAGCVSCRPMRRWRLPEAWIRLLARLTARDWPDGTDHGPALRAASSLSRQRAGRRERRSARRCSTVAHWRSGARRLLAGPAASLDLTLEALKQDDGLEACVSVAWMPASALAASPRRFVRLLGLNSSRWPRGISEDRLLSGPHHSDRRTRSASGRGR